MRQMGMAEELSSMEASIVALYRQLVVSFSLFHLRRGRTDMDFFCGIFRREEELNHRTNLIAGKFMGSASVRRTCMSQSARQ